MKEVFSHRLDEQLIGKVFGRLLVVKHIGRPPTHKLTHYECICECGKSVITPGSYLLDGHKKSCGCLYKEMWDGIRKPEGAAAKKSLYNSYRRQAKNRKHSFTLTLERAIELMSSDCFYCGAAPDQLWPSAYAPTKFNGRFVYNGLDRVDNALGYDEGNVVPCCWVCNNRKSASPVEEFLEWARKIAQNHPK
jgi:hypothetical protein